MSFLSELIFFFLFLLFFFFDLFVIFFWLVILCATLLLVNQTFLFFFLFFFFHFSPRNHLKQTSNLISYSESFILAFSFLFYIITTVNLWFRISFPPSEGVLSNSLVFHLRCGPGYHSDKINFSTFFYKIYGFVLYLILVFFRKFLRRVCGQSCN